MVFNGIEWVYKQGALIPNSSPHCSIVLTEEEQKSLLKHTRAYFLRWTDSFDMKESSFWYIIKDSCEKIEKLSSNTRSKIRRGEKRSVVRVIDKKTIRDEGYETYLLASIKYDTFEDIMTEKEFVNYIDKLDENKYQFWGVYDGQTNKLIAYSQNQIYDNVCFYEEMFFHPDYLKNYISYLLIYEMNRYYLERKSFKYISDGARSMSHNTNIHHFLIDKFNFRKAYCRLNIVYRWDVGLVVKILYPFRKIVEKLDSGFFKRLYVLLKHEKLRRDFSNGNT